jgi:hypothetical protein
MQLSHTAPVVCATFDEPNLVSAAGLVPLMALAEQAGLREREKPSTPALAARPQRSQTTSTPNQPTTKAHRWIKAKPPTVVCADGQAPPRAQCSASRAQRAARTASRIAA